MTGSEVVKRCGHTAVPIGRACGGLYSHASQGGFILLKEDRDGGGGKF